MWALQLSLWLGVVEGLATPRRAARGVGNNVAAGSNAEEEEEAMCVRSPLRWAGPYPTLALRFPALATAAQKARGASGVSLDFIVDTAANVNTINARVASELGLAQVGSAPAGAGASGAIDGGATFMLGDCELDEVAEGEERFLFAAGLTASALPVAAPAAAGLLGVGFLFAFPGGVAFDWDSTTPAVTFFGDAIGSADATEGLCLVPARQLTETGLVVVQLVVNGVSIDALLDTGSPITVLNAAAASAAGVAFPRAPPPNEKKGGAANPFARFAENLAENLRTASGPTTAGDLRIAGGDGAPVDLRRTAPTAMALGDADLGTDLTCYVGDLPGLALLSGLGAAAGPAAVLGTDLLRRRTSLLLRDGKVYV